MTMVWEDPAPAERVFGGSTRPKSQVRLESEAICAQLFQYPGKWARLWSEDTEVEARRKEQTLRSCADKGTLKVVVRETEHGYSVFAMAKEPKLTESVDPLQARDLAAQEAEPQGQGTFQ